MKTDIQKDQKARTDVLHNLLKGVKATGNPYEGFRGTTCNTCKRLYPASFGMFANSVFYCSECWEEVKGR